MTLLLTLPLFLFVPLSGAGLACCVSVFSADDTQKPLCPVSEPQDEEEFVFSDETIAAFDRLAEAAEEFFAHGDHLKVKTVHSLEELIEVNR